MSKSLLPNCGCNFLLSGLWAQSGDINHEIRVQGETSTQQKAFWYNNDGSQFRCWGCAAFKRNGMFLSKAVQPQLHYWFKWKLYTMLQISVYIKSNSLLFNLFINLLFIALYFVRALPKLHPLVTNLIPAYTCEKLFAVRYLFSLKTWERYYTQPSSYSSPSVEYDSAEIVTSTTPQYKCDATSKIVGFGRSQFCSTCWKLSS